MSNRLSFTLIGLLGLVMTTKAFSIRGRDLNAPVTGPYDYIIVGGGQSGLVVANRLTENPLGILPAF